MTNRRRNIKTRERQRRMVTRRRAALVMSLGSACARCGTARRIKLYEQDARDGNLRLLCRSCNARDGAAWRRVYAEQREQQEQAEYAAGMAEAMDAERAA